MLAGCGATTWRGEILVPPAAKRHVVVQMLSPRTRPSWFPSLPSLLGSKAVRSFQPAPPRDLCWRRNPVACGAEASPDDTAAEVAQVLNDAARLMAEVGRGQKVTKTEAPEAAEKSRLVLHCDVNGCTIAPVANEQVAARAPPGTVMGTLQDDVDMTPKDLVVMEGDSWKLGYDRAPPGGDQFTAFVGGEGWTLCLTREEFGDFVKLLRNLQRSVATLHVCGQWDSDSDEATLEMRTPLVWMQGRAPHKRLSVLQRLWSRKTLDSAENLPRVAFALRFMLTSPGRREVEGSWPADAVMDVLRVLEGEGSLENIGSETLFADASS